MSLALNLVPETPGPTTNLEQEILCFVRETGPVSALDVVIKLEDQPFLPVVKTLEQLSRAGHLKHIEGKRFDI